jgi:hypothetical protein
LAIFIEVDIIQMRRIAFGILFNSRTRLGTHCLGTHFEFLGTLPLQCAFETFSLDRRLRTLTPRGKVVGFKPRVFGAGRIHIHHGIKVAALG